MCIILHVDVKSEHSTILAIIGQFELLDEGSDSPTVEELLEARFVMLKAEISNIGTSCLAGAWHCRARC
jgi:hypothetical protein